jgi:hypothetical protein
MPVRGGLAPDPTRNDPAPDEEVHRLRLLPSREVLSELRDAGFRARLLAGYGELRFPPGLAGFLARPRTSPG